MFKAVKFGRVSNIKQVFHYSIRWLDSTIFRMSSQETHREKAGMCQIPE